MKKHTCLKKYAVLTWFVGILIVFAERIAGDFAFILVGFGVLGVGVLLFAVAEFAETANFARLIDRIGGGK